MVLNLAVPPSTTHTTQTFLRPYIPSSCMPLLSHLPAVYLSNCIGLSRLPGDEVTRLPQEEGSAHCLLQLLTPSQSQQSHVRRTKWDGNDVLVLCALPELPPRFVVGLTVCCGFQLPELSALEH